jgi:hypothetical protein
MRLIPRYAIIPTRNRFNVFNQCYEAIRGQVDRVIVINNGDEPLDDYMDTGDLTVIHDKTQPVNLSRLWNAGLSMARHLANTSSNFKWDVAILNDDCIVPDAWFEAVAGQMRQMKVAAGCSGGPGISMPILHTQPGPVPLHTRMQGFAFILAGEFGVRANEQLHWYFTDDHVDWLSRQKGGMVMVPGFQVDHLYPNGQMTEELQVQTAKDAEKFVAYWGMRPW